MIDNPDQVQRLLVKLRASLPLSATVTPPLAAVIRNQSPGSEAPRRCLIRRVDYAGDEGGIMCMLDLGGVHGDRAFFASITHLVFDGRAPLAREIAKYQKHRVKRLRSFGVPKGHLEEHREP